MNVFIVENSSAMRDSLQSALSDLPEIRVVGHAADESGAVERIGALLPDIVILDLSLQSGSGIGVLENIKRHRATIKVIALFGKSFQFMQLHKVLRKWAHTGRLDNRFHPGNKLNALQMAGG